MRFIHNFFQMFRKDSGAHFTYNIGVGFVRLAGILFGITFLLWLYTAISPPPDLSKLYKREMMITSVTTEMEKRYTGRRYSNYEYVRVYTVGFREVDKKGKPVDDTGFRQYTSKDQYPEYLRQENTVHSFYVYRDQNGRLFASLLDTEGARIEYGKLAERLSVTFARMVMIYTFMGSVIIFGIGASQEKLSMKYPRTDVGIDTTTLSAEQRAETDDLMREFDEAYDNFLHNKSAGLPTSQPPRTDGKYRPEKRNRLEKK